MTRQTPLVVLAFALVLVACGDSEEPAATVPTLDVTRLPVVLQSDTRITARADGSSFEEHPIARRQSYPDLAVSPDGRKRLAILDDAVVIETVDSGDVVSTGVPAESEWLNPVWSPDGARLMFDAYAGESSQLYVVNADGSGLRELASELGGDAFPLAWSDDARRIAFGVQDPASASVSGLYIAEDTGDPVLLGEFTNPQGDGGWDRPQFSPTGDKIAAFGGATRLSLRIFDAGGGAPVDVDSVGVSHFAWAPDGSAIAFDTTDAASQRSVIRIADAATGAAHTLTEGSSPRWSPAGDRVAFKRSTGAAELEVRTVRTDGSEDVAVGPPGYYAFGVLSWSTDGEQLSFTRPAFGAAQVFRVDLREATTATAIGKPIGQPGNPPQAVSLSPDERVLAFLSGAYDPRGAWYVQDLNTGNATLIAGGGFPFADIHWGDTGPVVATGGALLTVTGGGAGTRQLGLSRVLNVSFSPDGALIAASTFDGLWIVATDGSTRQRIVDADPEAETVQFVDWAPDGKRLTYNVLQSGGAAGTTRSFVADVDGTAAEITRPNPYGPVRWAPDGEWLAHVTWSDSLPTRQIWITDDDGANERLLASFDDGCCDTMLWSPDGAFIAVDGPQGVSLVDTATGAVTLAVVAGSGCSVRLAGWSATGDALYVYPACYTGI